jgi:hypothetical protein
MLALPPKLRLIDDPLPRPLPRPLPIVGLYLGPYLDLYLDIGLGPYLDLYLDIGHGLYLDLYLDIGLGLDLSSLEQIKHTKKIDDFISVSRFFFFTSKQPFQLWHQKEVLELTIKNE